MAVRAALLPHGAAVPVDVPAPQTTVGAIGFSLFHAGNFKSVSTNIPRMTGDFVE
jgi:hypothetical protein